MNKFVGLHRNEPVNLNEQEWNCRLFEHQMKMKFILPMFVNKEAEDVAKQRGQILMYKI